MDTALPSDHPTVKTWLADAYKTNAAGYTVVPIACTVRLKNGREYVAPHPPREIWDHLRRLGNDDAGRPLYISV